jgi:uncharacterized delta-60 repeat protein
MRNLCLTILAQFILLTAFPQAGQLDPAFDPEGGTGNFVFSTTVQPNGKILAGGDFQTFAAANMRYVVRLEPDGSVDTGFNTGTGPNNYIRATAVQADGKALIGGFFTSFNGTPINRIARLNVDGTLDATFNIGSGAAAPVYKIVVQPDGKIIVCGQFLSFNGVPVHNIVRLNADGTLDPAFSLSGADGAIRDAALQSDGKIAIGGHFTACSGITRLRVAKLNADGTLDMSFDSQ